MAFLLDRLIPSSLQVLVNITEYLSEDRYGKWLKVEGNGEEAKFWCWVCHQYTGAKDLLGTSKTLPACEEKLSIHDKHAEHINAFKRHLASLNPKGTIQQALTVIPVAEEDMNTLRCISWLIDHKMSAGAAAHKGSRRAPSTARRCNSRREGAQQSLVEEIGEANGPRRRQRAA